MRSSILWTPWHTVPPLICPWVYYSSPVGDVLIPIDEALHPQTHSLMGEPTADCITECPEQPASAREPDGGTSNKGPHFKGTVIFAKSKNMCRYGSVSCKKQMPFTVYALYLFPHTSLWIWWFYSDTTDLLPQWLVTSDYGKLHLRSDSSKEEGENLTTDNTTKTEPFVNSEEQIEKVTWLFDNKRNTKWAM